MTASLTSNADNEQIHGLQHAVDKLQSDVDANTTSITDLQSTVAGNWPRSSPTSAPSPRIDDDKEREKNVEAEDPQQTEGEKDMEKEGLAITDEEDESSFIPITKAPSTKPTQIIIEAEDKSTEDEEEDDEQLNIDDDGLRSIDPHLVLQRSRSTAWFSDEADPPDLTSIFVPSLLVSIPSLKPVAQLQI
ncbi:hypothetical protein L6452_17249 [Arctium lappa]|uniref:Uncharacterized protein n=1 Tax=Arctium lappa TaxID=4217 RepID=A0ACB9C2S1_ARCLA|nr:hypothetical protein L6452_17249 [Arctium lappa]